MKSILKQTSWLFFAQVITRIIGFFYTIFLARNLGVSDFGLFTAALAYFSLVSSVADFGFNRFLIREVAVDKLKTAEFLANVSMLRLTVASMLFAIFSLGLYFLDPDKIRVNLTLLLILAILPQAVAQTFDGIFIAFQRLQYSAISLLITSFVTVILGIILVISGFGPMGAASALIIGQLVYLTLLIIILARQKVPFFYKVTSASLKRIIMESSPYGILTILGLIYFRIDTILLTYLKGNFDTGIYGVAYRFLEAAIILPSTLSTAFFPIFAKQSQKIYQLYFKAVLMMIVLSVFMVIAFVFILPIFIQMFLSQYLVSLDVIKILALSIPFFFVNSLQATLLLAQKKLLNKLIFISVLIICFNIFFNYLSIPKFSYFGAAWVTVATEIIVFLIFLYLIKRFFKR